MAGFQLVKHRSHKKLRGSEVKDTVKYDIVVQRSQHVNQTIIWTPILARESQISVHKKALTRVKKGKTDLIKTLRGSEICTTVVKSTVLVVKSHIGMGVKLFPIPEHRKAMSSILSICPF